MTGQTTQYLVGLHRLLMAHYDEDELQSLCFKLGIVYADVAGDTRSRKGEELLLYIARRDRLAELLAIIENERPETQWPPIPPDFKLLTDSPEPRQAPLSSPTVNIGQAGIVNVGGIQNFNESLSFGETAVSQQKKPIQSPADELSLLDLWRKIENRVIKLPLGSASQRESIWLLIRQLGEQTIALAQNKPEEANTVTSRAQKLLQSLAEDPLDPDMVEIRGNSLQKASDKVASASPDLPQLSQEIVQQCLLLFQL